MQRLKVSGAVQSIYGSLGVEQLLLYSQQLVFVILVMTTVC